MSLGRRSPLSRLRVYSIHQEMVKPKRLKHRKSPKMELYRKRMPDYSELAYREAMAKLKYLLAESYTPVGAHSKAQTVGLSGPAAEKDWSETPAYPLEASRFRPSSEELSPYLRRQEDYIDHLEKEGNLYREELSRVLDKVKEVVGNQNREETEEEDSEKEPKVHGRSRRGPSIVYSSRISELEAQLTQCRLELRKAQDEASYLKAHSKPIQPPVSQQYIHELESIQRERDELNQRVSSLQNLVSQLRDKEASASEKAKRSLDVVDQAQFDKNQLETEVRRLRSELDRMNEKQREALQDSARRVSEAERRYAMQMERLNGDLAAQWDAANRLNLELDRARRTETELRRELAQKAANMEELKKELTTKTGSLQSEALAAGAERESLESELTASRLATERAERQGRQEVARLQAEVQALRSRLDRADQDLLYSRKENIRLADVIAGLEKELNLAKLTKDSTASKESKKAEELTSMIKELDAKHAESVSELEGLIQSQTELMEKLNAECQGLTRKLEESSARHKEEMAKLQNNIDYLSSKLEAPQHYQWQDDEKLENYNDDVNSTERKEGRVKAVTGPSQLAQQVFDEIENEKVTEKQTYSKQEANKSEIQPQLKNQYYNEEKNKSYSQKVNNEEIKNDYLHEQPYNDKDAKIYKEERIYNTPALGNNKKEFYDQSGTKEYKPEQEEYDSRDTEGYNQGQKYDQIGIEGNIQEQEYDHSGTEGYNQVQEYDQDSTEIYNQGQKYEQNRKEEYNQGQEYNQRGTGEYQQEQEYEQNGLEGYNQAQEYDSRAAESYELGKVEGYQQGQVYSNTGPEGYDNDQVYSNSGAEGYEHDQVYDLTGSKEYQQNQGYDTGHERYEQGQPYDQQAEDGYDQSQLYDPSNEGYGQDQRYDPTTEEYDHGQVYDQTGAEQYEHNQAYNQLQDEGYNQNQGQVDSGAAYPQAESYDQNTTNQAYSEGNFETEGYTYEEKK